MGQRPVTPILKVAQAVEDRGMMQFKASKEVVDSGCSQRNRTSCEYPLVNPQPSLSFVNLHILSSQRIDTVVA